MASTTVSTTADKYYIPSPSNVMIPGSLALLLLALGAAAWFNDHAYGPWIVVAGFALLIFMMVRWFVQVVAESESGRYNKQVDVAFRWGMSWFIFSEVMFFGAFFGALFYARVLSVPWLGEIEQKWLWPDFTAVWPSAGPMAEGSFSPIGAWGIPALNTALLLSSGVTITIAHHALRANERLKLNFFLFLTIVLGVIFLAFQAYEYHHLYTEANLKLSTGIYGSTFFMLTGFHGFHVTVGVIMLTVILFRCLLGHFRPDHHFAFEGVAWYWHFVDVVWLLLFVLVYWL